MEVGEEGIDESGFVGGVDEEVAFSAHGRDGWVVGFTGAGGDGFEGSYAGGADGYDSSAGLFGACDLFCSSFAYLESLGVHGVGGEVVCRYRFEGSDSDVERDACDAGAAGFDFAQEFFREVESGGGGRDGACFFGEDGLVSIAIFGCFAWGRGFGLTFDVGRKWRGAYFG